MGAIERNAGYDPHANHASSSVCWPLLTCSVIASLIRDVHLGITRVTQTALLSHNRIISIKERLIGVDLSGLSIRIDQEEDPVRGVGQRMVQKRASAYISGSVWK